MKFTVIRQEWMRGSTDGRLFIEGKRCCLGFLGLACGLSDNDMDGYGEPEELKANWPNSIAYRCEDIDDETGYAYERFKNTSLCGDIIHTNDDASLTEEEREKSLGLLFLRGGIEVEFKDAP